MHFFDAQIRSDTRSDDDLKNLAYFDTTHVVTTPNPARISKTADELCDYLRMLATDEPRRLSRLGITPLVALGLLPAARPRRTHHEVWNRLPTLLQLEHVVALGEIGAWDDTQEQWEIFERQVTIGLELDLPLIVTPPADLRVNMTFKMMQRLSALGMPPSRVMFNHAEERTLEAILSDGYYASLTVGAYYMEPRSACGLLEAQKGGFDQVMLNSGLREGLADILGIPKTVVALREAGASLATIEAVTFGSAQSFFLGLTTPS